MSDLADRIESGDDACAIEINIFRMASLAHRAECGDRKMRQVAKAVLMSVTNGTAKCFLCNSALDGNFPAAIAVMTDLLDPIQGAIGHVCLECYCNPTDVSERVRAKLKENYRVVNIDAAALSEQGSRA